MSKTSHPQNDLNQDDSFVLISRNSLKRLEEKIDTICQHLTGENNNKHGINGYLSEKQAMEQFKRSHTWFWTKRKSGVLQFSKVGKTIYYQQEQLFKLIESEN